MGAGAGVALTGLAASPVAASATHGNEWDRLARRLDGDLVRPDSPAYRQARQLASGQYDKIRPRAVVYCSSNRDVQQVIRFAGHHDLHTAIRSGGHSFGGFSTGGGIVLDVSRLADVTVRRDTVLAGPGVQQVDALHRLAPQGLMLAGGVCPNVCLGGFVQGGGIGLLTRGQGLACDQLVAARVVLADGQTVRASRDEHPDLFWALRGGGGGNFGVVTGYELQPVALTSMVNYTLTWPFEEAVEVITGWQSWAAAAPEQLGASLGVITVDAGSAQPQVAVYGAWTGPEAGLDRLLDRLTAEVGSMPTTRSVQAHRPYDAMMQWYGCADLTVDQCHRVGYSPEAVMPRSNFYATRNRMFARPLPAGELRRMLDVFASQGRTGQFRLLYFEALGGAASALPRQATAYVHRDATLLGGYAVSLTDPAYQRNDVSAAKRWLADGFAILDHEGRRESYQNFIDPDLPDWRRSYYAENYGRLAEVKHRYDRHGFFRFAQGID